MRLVIDLGGRYDRAPDGGIWVKSGCLYQYWTRYLGIFDEVVLVARARDVDSPAADLSRVDGDGVRFHAVPYFEGPLSYARQARGIRAAARRSVRWGDAVVLSGSPLAPFMADNLRRTGYPYAMRMIGDPYDLFAPGANDHPMRPILRYWITRQVTGLCHDACSAIYVTRQALQERYPCPGLCVGVSDVDLPAAAFLEVPREMRKDSGPIRIVMVGSLAERYKAPHVLIGAAARCARHGLDVRLTMVGDGRLRPSLEALTERLGISGRVEFLGQLSNERVKAELDRADLFVLPSFQEGLPRALVEAMARGLPCIGSTVGGIPELLPAEDMVAPGYPDLLAAKIREVVTDPRRMERMSARNLSKAREFQEGVLWDRWSGFYTDLRERTQYWLEKNKESGFFT